MRKFPAVRAVVAVLITGCGGTTTTPATSDLPDTPIVDDSAYVSEVIVDAVAETSAEATVEDGGSVKDGAVVETSGEVAVDAGGADACVPTTPSTEVCDRVDNDCNGLVDDVDKGKDGIYDCLKIGLFGNAGAYGSSNFLAWLGSNGLDGVKRLQTDSTPLTPEILKAYDLIILDQLVRDYTDAEAELLRTWVANGGGLMSMTGYTGGGPDRTRPNTLLKKFGLEYTSKLLSQPVKKFNSHPTTAGLTSVTFNGGYPIAKIAGSTPAGTATVVAEFPDATAAGVAYVEAKGRVFIWGDEWIEFDSEWKAIPDIKMFWGNITGWLGGFKK